MSYATLEMYSLRSNRMARAFLLSSVNVLPASDVASLVLWVEGMMVSLSM